MSVELSISAATSASVTKHPNFELASTLVHGDAGSPGQFVPSLRYLPDSSKQLGWHAERHYGVERGLEDPQRPRAIALT